MLRHGRPGAAWDGWSRVNAQAGECHLGREFPMSNSDFQAIRELVHSETGIHLAETKRDMVYGRLAKRIRAVGLGSFAQYLQLVRDPIANELPNLVNAITTNLTFFFREPHHFDFLRDTALPEAVVANRGQKRVRIWSAGCSTGEEPYSIAITAHEFLHRKARAFDCKILASDLDSNVLDTGRVGIYDISRVEGINAIQKKKFFLKRGDEVRVKDVLRPYIQFKQLNLLKTWPMKGPFDIIFCRNVLIYFDQPTQQRLFERYASLLRMGGYLIIGHSESMTPRNPRFEYLGKTIYQKCG